MPSTTRRELLASAGAAAAATGLAGCTGAACGRGDLGPVNGEWPMDGAGPGHPGYSAVAQAPRGDPTIGWCFETVATSRSRSVGTPAVVPGKPSGAGRGDVTSGDPGAVFVPATVRSTRASLNHYLHTLDAATGEEYLRIQLRGQSTGPPAVAGATIVVVQRLGTDRGRVDAFDRRDGSLLWSHGIDARVTAPPTVAGDLVYVADWSGRIVALDLDGRVRWERTVEREVSHTSFWDPPAVVDGTLYAVAGSVQPGLYALDAADGSERWTLPDAPLRGGPVVAEDRLLAVGDSYVQAYDPADGTPVWTVNVDTDDRLRRPSMDHDRAYVPAGEKLHAVRLADGESAWTADLGDPPAGRPAVGYDTVHVPTRSGLPAFDVDDGEPEWNFGRARGSPALAYDVVFVPGGDGELLAVVECRGLLC